MADDRNHSLLLTFDTEGVEFARGFELGRLWTLLREHDGEVVEQLHAVNGEMLLRMAEATGRTVVTEDLDDTWFVATFSEMAA